ncbi:MAG: hypothetical protein QFX33_04325 [Candidatus Nezhaarchaeota archaeon]|nr:hypothetical protein [Candidatus Nezhaarchaeota archaeon]
MDDAKRLLMALVAFSAVYGVFVVNLVDLGLPLGSWYHVFLGAVYFCPSITIIIASGWRSWSLAAALGILISLMNDLLYGPISNMLSLHVYDLAEWFAWQLGLHGSSASWTFQGGLIKFTMTSTIMGVSIYARLVAMFLLFAIWWRNTHSRRRGLLASRALRPLEEVLTRT